MRIVTCASMLAVFSLLSAGWNTTASAEVIRIGGTGFALGTMQQLGEAFEKKNPEHSVKVVPSLGTSGGLKALQSGALELAVTARDLKPEEKAANLSATKYGTTALAFVSHAKVATLPLTIEKIADIYSGRQATWPGGQPIRLVLRPQQESETQVVKKMSPAVEAAVNAAHERTGMVIAITDSEAADHIERTMNAFGTSALSLVLSEGRKMTIHPVNGVMPSSQTVTDGTYPHTRTAYIVAPVHTLNGAAQFLQFMRSSQGLEILRRNGYITH